MAVQAIVVTPNEVLSQKTKNIKNITDKIRKLAADMADTMYKAPGIGLAANQIGESLSMIVIDVKYAYDKPETRKKEPVLVINPRVTHCDGESVREEGCLSVPEFSVEVPRSECVQVVGVDIDGNPVKIEADGLLACVLQHEIDHLNGTTLLDHASALKRNLYLRKVRKKARRQD